MFFYATDKSVAIFVFNWLVCDCSLHRSVTVIGRGANQVDYTISSDSAIQNLYVSRIHARIVRTGNTYCIHDDSKNGIFINNVKIGGLYVISTASLQHCSSFVYSRTVFCLNDFMFNF